MGDTPKSHEPAIPGFTYLRFADDEPQLSTAGYTHVRLMSGGQNCRVVLSTMAGYTITRLGGFHLIYIWARCRMYSPKWP